MCLSECFRSLTLLIQCYLELLDTSLFFESCCRVVYNQGNQPTKARLALKARSRNPLMATESEVPTWVSLLEDIAKKAKSKGSRSRRTSPRGRVGESSPP